MHWLAIIFIQTAFQLTQLARESSPRYRYPQGGPYTYWMCARFLIPLAFTNCGI